MIDDKVMCCLCGVDRRRDGKDEPCKGVSAVQPHAENV